MADRWEVVAEMLIKSNYSPMPTKTKKTVSVEALDEAGAKRAAEKLVMHGESRDKVVSVNYVSIKKIFTGYRNTSFANGRAKAEVCLNQKMAAAGVKVENELEMTIEQIKKGAREGRWEPQVDVDGKRPGQYVWVRRSGKDIYTRVK